MKNIVHQLGDSTSVDYRLANHSSCLLFELVLFKSKCHESDLISTASLINYLTL